MLIETEPCKECDFSPEYCSCDIDICQITRGESKPVSEEKYKREKLREYKKIEFDSIRNHEYPQNNKQAAIRFNCKRLYL